MWNGVIKLKEIAKYYYSENSVTLALKDINLEFKKGEFVAITGKSGGGKSTLINLISGMDSYEEGEMYFKGMETSYYDDRDWELYRKNNISFVYQSYNLIDSYTAIQNVEAVLMICEHEGNRLTKKQRKERAMSVLKKVGLEKQAHNKASHMSSGQKQRLGIARALAKDTDVIIADEPTGNLDVENGKAIMKILYDLSKENKLVIVVTHNYEQAEPFVTRKIRLFDGEVIEDLRIDNELYEGKDFQSDFGDVVAEEMEAKDTFRVARQFVKINRFAQPHRTFFVMMFLLVSAMATVIFLGQFISNLDDSKTRAIYQNLFNNTDDTRIIVKSYSGEPLTEEDYEKLKNISKVEYVEKYDEANDANYFYVEDKDYRKRYEVGTATQKITIDKLYEGNFIKSAAAISEKNLSAGRLPEALNEIVIYSADTDRIGETIEIYISYSKWKDTAYAGNEYTIVGILAKETDQIYFSETVVQAGDYVSPEGQLRYEYTIDELTVYGDGTSEDFLNKKDRGAECTLVIGEGLTGNQVRVSTAITYNLNPEGKNTGVNTIYRTLNDSGMIKKILDDGTTVEYEITYLPEGNLGSNGMLEVSEELYKEILGEPNTVQASLFIDDYAYTDDVIYSLNKEGYEAISAMRVSALEYDSELVSSRLTTLAVSAAIMVVVFILSIFVIYLLMKLKKGDFIIMKSLGMKQKMANQMNYYDLITMVIVADILAVIVGYVCSEFDVPLISEIMKYYRIKHFIVLLAINISMAAVTSAFFNKYLGKRFSLVAFKNS